MLTQQELFIAKNLGFEVKILELLKRETTNLITQRPIFNERNEFIEFSNDAILSNISDIENGKIALKNIKKRKISKNYFPFLSNIGSHRQNQITILKAHNQFDILRFQKTDGDNYGVYTDDIIEKLTIWEELYGLSIIGAGYSWVLFEIKRIKKDINWFAQELFEFCPDIIYQDFGDMESLIEHLKCDNEIYLWWD
jgi:Domain of unknown function (DUF4253)